MEFMASKNTEFKMNSVLWRRERDSNPRAQRANGFQDRLVMTASISLRMTYELIYSIVFIRPNRYKTKIQSKLYEDLYLYLLLETLLTFIISKALSFVNENVKLYRKTFFHKSRSCLRQRFFRFGFRSFLKGYG